MTLMMLPRPSATTKPVVSPSIGHQQWSWARAGSNACRRFSAKRLLSSASTGTRSCAGSAIQRLRSA